MKILWHSNAPWVPTGYGSQTGLFTPMIRDAGHDVAISAFWGVAGRALEWEGMRLYPGGNDYGDKWLAAYAAHHGNGDPTAVQIITLLDVWVIAAPILKALNVASWVPVDHDPVPPNVAAYFKLTGAAPIAMSRFGEAKLREAGLNPLYVPHGIDTDQLRPIDQREVRAALEIPEDRFVVGMVAANKGINPPRKAFPQALAAFAEFHKAHPDALLYMHSDSEGDLDLHRVARSCGLDDDAILFTPPFELQIGVEYQKMAWVYSNMDVLLSPSYGEGFGIPIVEAQACGVPVIVNDFSAMQELCGAGWRVGGAREYHPPQDAFWQNPSIPSIVDALEDAYERRGELRDQAREFALSYDTRRVMAEYWTPVLAELEARMGSKPKVLQPKALAA